MKQNNNEAELGMKVLEAYFVNGKFKMYLTKEFSNFIKYVKKQDKLKGAENEKQ